ncbi:sigma-E factor negative regulatory protein [Pseudoduganella violacea]|uniref:Sigma-E factor negative regulatory protein RseA n=1 Tax=Pseudoduganella violacea TaxID=1715466 RepID=A0A7W5FW50_9BURK|nr:sigma-E factor negative regulatory protein [Pseudoduganella violacea]MBB3121670.1 sigma-E factor negative regulatory protein RseA [Pseudoduganella violacea]
MKKSTQLLEHISALMDGELADADRELALAALTGDEGRAAWHAYHLIGDQLRAAADREEGAGAALAARLRLRRAVAAEVGSAPPFEDDGATPAATIP